MVVTMIGTGSILTARLSACVLIDGRILIDAPNGAMKQIRRLVKDVSKIDICLITHFHGDHYFDLPFLLMEHGLLQERARPLHIVGPVGIGSRMRQLYDLAYPTRWEMLAANAKLDFIEVPRKPFVEIALCGYEITAVEVRHGDLHALGYRVRHGDKAVGITGDAEWCDGVEFLARTSDLVIADTTFPQPQSGHMGVTDIERLAAMFRIPPQRLIATHMTDEVHSLRRTDFTIPQDGDEFMLE
jgi:ribonuclease BN (tRNA processing enzyme)